MAYMRRKRFKFDDSSENDSEVNVGHVAQYAYYGESDSEEGEIDYPYVNAIRNNIDMVDSYKFGTFACGGILEKAKLKLDVQGVEIRLPLSYRQGEVLKNLCTSAPYGKGSETLLDPLVRDAWQVDAKDVTLDQKFNKLINETVIETITTLMGESAEDQQVESELYKLVYYEKGGHFVAHRDTEKAPGMFATLVIQLPAGHEGGKLVVRHKGETKEFDFEDDSKDNFYYTAFFADCEHELTRIIGGQRLVLIYNLIRKNSHPTLYPNSNDDNAKPSNNQSFMSIMNKSVEEWESDDKRPKYLALTLDHLYTNTNISFQQLKGKDKKVANALCSCEGIKVYLATITKNEKRHGYGNSKHDPDVAPLDEYDVEPSSYKLNNWKGVNNNKTCFGERKLHKKEMFLKEEDMFTEDDERCNSDYEYTGNAGVDIEYFYKKRALVFLPKSFELSMSCDSNLGSVLVNCKKLSESNMDDALEMFKGILLYIETRHNQAMKQMNYSSNIASIFELIILFEDTFKCQANTFLLSLIKPSQSRYSSHKVGLPDKDSAVALAKLINRLGWNSLEISVLKLVKECAISQTESCVQLVSSLLSLGLYEEAIRVVELAAPQIVGQGDDLSIEGRCIQTFLSIWQKDGWKNLSLKSITLFWPLVLFVEKIDFDASLLKSFVQAVIGHENSCTFLKALLKSPNVVEAKRNPLVMLVVEKRLQQLDVSPPVFSWAMPDALEVTKSSTVGVSLYNFLVSDQETKTFVGVFENVKHAGFFGRKYFDRNDNSKYSAEYEISGRGRNAECEVTKTKDCFNEQVKLYNLMLNEAKFLKENFSDSKISVSSNRGYEEDI